MPPAEAAQAPVAHHPANAPDGAVTSEGTADQRSGLLWGPTRRIGRADATHGAGRWPSRHAALTQAAWPYRIALRSEGSRDSSSGGMSRAGRPDGAVAGRLDRQERSSNYRGVRGVIPQAAHEHCYLLFDLGIV